MRDDAVVVAGWSVPRPGVAKLVGELRGFQQHFERVFLELAAGLPSVSSSVQALTAPFTSLRDPERGLAEQVQQQVSLIVGHSHAAVESVLALSEASLKSAAALGQTATGLAAQLDGSLAVSQSLRLAGLNARFAVSGMGQQAAAFNAVNRELIDLAAGAVELGQTMSQTARQTREVATSIGVAQQTVTDAMRAVTADAEAGSQRVVAACADVLAGVDSELADLTASGQQVAAATSVVMGAIQQQDILRQGLDHVIVVLEALDDAFDRLAQAGQPTQALMAFLSFEQAASRLSADLLEDLGQQLGALQTTVVQPLSGVDAAARAIGERGEHLDQLAKRLGGAADLRGLGLTALPQHEAEVGTCERQVEEFETQLRALRPALQQLYKVPLQINVVSVLLKSEIARVDELAGAARVTDALGAASARFRTLSDAAGDGITEVAERVALLKRALKRQRGAWDGVRTLPGDVGGAVNRIHQLALEFGHQLTSLAGGGRGLHQRTAGLLGDLAEFGQGLSVIDRVRGVCTQWGVEADSLREQLTAHGIAPAEASASLRALIDGFTVFAHKQIALGAGETAAEHASQPGELTLF